MPPPRSPFRRTALTIASFSLLAAASVTPLLGVTYNYTPTTPNGTDNWSAGPSAGWSATPVSAATTSLVFVTANATTVSGTYTSNDDFTTATAAAGPSGGFLLNSLSLQGTGVAAGGTINITSSSLPLEFTVNGSTQPTVNLTAIGPAATPLTYSVSSGVIFDATTTFTGNGTATFNFSGPVSGVGGLTKAGSSVLTLSGTNNTYAGATTVNAGTVNAVSLANGGLASSIGNSSADAANLIFGGGALAYTGTTQASTDRLFTMAGNATLNSAAGGVNYTNTGSIAQTGAAARTLTLTGASAAGTNSLAALIGNGGTGTSLTNSGAWTIANTGNTYTGITTLSGGTLSVASLANGGVASSIGQSSNAAANLVINGGTLAYVGTSQASTDRLITMNAGGGLGGGTAGVNFASTGAIVQTGTASARTLTLSGAATGSSSLAAQITDSGTGAALTTVSVTGPWTLSNASNSFSGGLNVTATTLTATNSGAVGTGTITTLGLTTAPATLNFQGTSAFTLPNNVIVSRTGSFPSVNTVLTGNQNVTVNGYLSNNSGQSYALTVNNAGTTTFNGMVQMGSTTGNARAFTVDGSGAVVFGSQSTVVNGAQNTTAGTTPLAASLIYNGTGSLTLSGTNSYTGTTTVSNGTLLINSAVPAGAVSATTVTNGGVTTSGTIGGNSTVSGLLSVASGATLAPGATVGSSTAIFTAGGGLTLNGAYTIDLAGTAPGTGYDQVSVVGALTLSATTSTLVFNSVTGTLTVGQKFYIMLNDGTDTIGGRFGNIPTANPTITDGQGDVFTVSYTDNGDNGSIGNDVSLTVFSLGTTVPEPSTVVGSLLLTGYLGWHCLRRRQVTDRIG